MKKKYTLLNSSIEVEGTEELIKYIDSDIIEFPLYTKKPREYIVSYEYNPSLYDDILVDLKRQIGHRVRIFGDEYKMKYTNTGIVFLVDDDSIIVHMENKFTIYGKTDFSKNHVLYLIREAVYEGYLLDKDLILHSAAFSTNHEQGNILVGAPGAGKTTLLMECLLGLPSAYISNDLVGVHNNRALASIIPVRVAHGTLSRFNHQEYSDLKEKETYMLNDFLKAYSLETDSDVRIKNIIFPHFDKKNNFYITKIDKKEAKDILISQTLNYGDDVRPYLWVNELVLNQTKSKTVDAKLNSLIGSSESFYLEYGPNIRDDEKKVMRKVMKI